MLGKESEDVEELKNMLKRHSREDIMFNEPHFTHQLMLREGDKEAVIMNMLHPDKLVYSFQQVGKYGDIIHCLHFGISNSRTLRIPVIFRKDKTLYILTYIVRYRRWQNMVRGGYLR